jgi:hypothetical protein
MRPSLSWYLIRGFKMADHGRRQSRTEFPVRGHTIFEKDIQRSGIFRYLFSMLYVVL